MTIQFGASPIAWTNDDLPELGGDTSLESCLQDLQDLGFDGSELGNKFPRDAETLREKLDEFGVKLVSGWYSANLINQSAEAEIQAMQPHLELLRTMHCDVMVFAETSNAIHGAMNTPLSESPSLNDIDWEQYKGRINTVADYLASEGVRLAYHHHMGTIVENEAEIRQFLSETNHNVGLVLDTGHAVMAGADPIALIGDFAERIIHVHCKDIRPDVLAEVQQQGKSFLEGVLDGMFTVPGDGFIDFDAVMAALKDIDYDSWIVIEAEQDPAKADPRTYAEKGLGTLKALHAKYYL